LSGARGFIVRKLSRSRRVRNLLGAAVDERDVRVLTSPVSMQVAAPSLG